jgi:Fe-S cluster assembly iron-binding protein IscA
MVLTHLAGMSYMMDFEKPTNVSSEDAVMEYEGGFRLVCDPKSLLYLFGECH